MKKLVLLALTLLATQASFAKDGNAAECYDMALSVPSTFGADVQPIADKIIRTDSVICTVENNVQWDADQMYGQGQITVTISNRKGVVAKYEFTAVSGDGALGTFYTSYGKSVDDLKNMSGDNDEKVLTFAMRNDHLKKGEYAGRVQLNGSRVILLQR